MTQAENPEPRAHRARRARRGPAARRLGEARRDPGGHARDGDATREPDQRLQRVRRHPHARARAHRREQRAHPPVAAWREAPYFSDAERAALALTEAATRLADRPDPVPDEVWDEAARHYTEPQLAALVVAIATINAFNRVNAATRQITGDYVARIVEAAAGAAA